MSTWGIGDHHDSDEVHALKEQLRTKGLQSRMAVGNNKSR